MFGFADLDFEEAHEKIDKVIKYLRVSDENQKDKSGKPRQEDSLDNEIERLGVDDPIVIADEWESASTMLRANIEKIIDIVEEDEDSRYCLMLEDIDRLSRAEPFEACVFFWIMKEYDVIVYFDTMGYFDFSDPNQQLMAFFGLYQSRQDYNKLRERTTGGQKDVKEKGGLPNQAPYGYFKKKGSNVIYKNEGEASLIRDGVTILLNNDVSIKKAYSEIENKYKDTDVNVPHYTTFLQIIRRELYTGKIKHDGEVVGECPVIISEAEFNALQERLGSNSSEQIEEQFDHVLNSVIERFGVDASLKLFDIIKGRCLECGGDVDTWGSDKRWGHRVLRYKCVKEKKPGNPKSESQPGTPNGGEDNDEDDGCGFVGPLLTEKILQRWENKIPIVCPLCQTPADDDKWVTSESKQGAIEQTCDECGRVYSIDLTDKYKDALKRGMDFPEYAIRWFRGQIKDEDTEEDDDDSESKPDNGSSDEED